MKRTQSEATLRTAMIQRLKLFPLIKLIDLSSLFNSEIASVNDQRDIVVLKLSKLRASLFSSSILLCYVTIQPEIACKCDFREVELTINEDSYAYEDHQVLEHVNLTLPFGFL